MTDHGEVLLYQAAPDGPQLEVRFSDDTVWLSQSQIAELFGVQRPAINKHLGNIYATGELAQADSCSILEHETARGPRAAKYYNLDAIISVGYRVNSVYATAFRRWATGVLREHLVTGYTVNTRRLEQIGKVLEILQRSDDDLVAGVAELLARFTDGLDLLDRYDHQSLAAPAGAASEWVFSYAEARSVIDAMAYGASSELFGHERDGSFPGVIAGLYQTFDRVELYPTAQEKAVHLLYLIVKDHCFSDGNKRIAAALFVYFLNRSGLLISANGRPRVGNSTLAAITVMIAVSRPEEKDDMILLVRNLLDVGAS